MLIILALHFLASQGTQALPIAADRAIDQSMSASCSDIGHCRTIWNIIWSCLVTIFGCTWVAVHPNIPQAEEKWFTAVLRRLQIMVMALIAPELVISWAMRQWLAARSLAKDNQSMLVCNCGSSSKFTDVRYPQNTNGRRLTVFFSSWEGLSMALHRWVKLTSITSRRMKSEIGAKETCCRKGL